MHYCTRRREWARISNFKPPFSHLIHFRLNHPQTQKNLVRTSQKHPKKYWILLPRNTEGCGLLALWFIYSTTLRAYTTNFSQSSTTTLLQLLTGNNHIHREKKNPATLFFSEATHHHGKQMITCTLSIGFPSPFGPTHYPRSKNQLKIQILSHQSGILSNIRCLRPVLENQETYSPCICRAELPTNGAPLIVNRMR